MFTKMNISPQYCVLFLTLLAAIFEFVAATPEWYTASDGNEYLIEKESEYNWLQAYDECARRDLHLAVIDNAEKNEAFDALLRQIFARAPNLWLGHHDEFNKTARLERSFYSIATGKPLTFGNWDPGQPNHPDYWFAGEPNNLNYNEHCVQIYGGTDFKWNDKVCDRYFYGYICEKNQHSTNCNDMNMEEIRLAIYDKNQQLSADYANMGIEMKEVLENNYNISQNIFEGLKETTNEILMKAKASLNAMVLRKPYLNAVIADVGDEIREIIRAALEDISKVSSEGQQTITNDYLSRWTSVSDIYSEFAEKLENNKNSIDNLFV